MRSILKTIKCCLPMAADLGLNEFEIRNPPPIFAIVGPNGSGKSRLISYIQRVFNRRSGTDIDKLSPEIILNGGKYPDKIIHYGPVDYETMTVQKAGMSAPRDAFNSKDIVNAAHFSKNSFLIIQNVVTNYIHASSNLTDIDENERMDRIKVFEKMNDLIFSLIGERVGIDNSGFATLFGSPLENANLSNGQMKLLQYSSAIFDHSGIDDHIILLFDEPESHLHPDACIKLIEEISKRLINGQIIVATHDISLVSYIGKDNIWCMSSGSAYFAGKKSEEVLLSLCGGEGNISKIVDFLVEPERAAVMAFLAECLLPPTVADPSDADPQSQQVVGVLESAPITRNQKIRLCDWGAGKGRLATELAFRKNNSDIIGRLEYYAFDLYDDDKDTCLDAISLLHASPAAHYFSNFQEIKENGLVGAFDVVVLCNVLHEIEPAAWEETLKDIAEALSQNGRLVVLEDLLISHGEIANRHGFILLDPNAFAILIDQDKHLFEVKTPGPDSRYSDRLVAYVVEKKMLSKATRTSVVNALRSTVQTSKNTIVEIRNLAGRPSYEIGHKHALAMAQYANASLALDGLSVGDEPE